MEMQYFEWFNKKTDETDSNDRKRAWGEPRSVRMLDNTAVVDKLICSQVGHHAQVSRHERFHVKQEYHVDQFSALWNLICSWKHFIVQLLSDANKLKCMLRWLSKAKLAPTWCSLCKSQQIHRTIEFMPTWLSRLMYSRFERLQTFVTKHHGVSHR